MKFKATIVLILALFVPVLVYIFLKIFGKNQFQIPKFHQTKIENVTNKCNLTYAIPYFVPDTTIQSLGVKKGSAALVLFNKIAGENEIRLMKQVKNKSLNIIVLSSLLNSIERTRISCVLLMPANINAVLIDDNRIIRGYYELESREEMDRLFLELQILFNNY